MLSSPQRLSFWNWVTSVSTTQFSPNFMAAPRSSTTLTADEQLSKVHLAQAGMCAEVVVGNLATRTVPSPPSRLCLMAHSVPHTLLRESRIWAPAATPIGPHCPPWIGACSCEDPRTEHPIYGFHCSLPTVDLFPMNSASESSPLGTGPTSSSSFPSINSVIVSCFWLFKSVSAVQLVSVNIPHFNHNALYIKISLSLLPPS